MDIAEAVAQAQKSLDILHNTLLSHGSLAAADQKLLEPVVHSIHALRKASPADKIGEPLTTEIDIMEPDKAVVLSVGEEASKDLTPSRPSSPLRKTRGTKRGRPEDVVVDYLGTFVTKRQCLGRCLTQLPPELTLVVLSWCDTRSLAMVEMCCRRFGRGTVLGPISLPQAAARAALKRKSMGGISQQQLGPQLWVAKLRLHEQAELAVESIKETADKKKITGAYAVNTSKGLLSQAAVGGPFSVMAFVEEHFPLSVQSRVRWSVAVILAAMVDPELQENGAAAILALAGAETAQERLVNCAAIRTAGAVPYLVHVLLEGTARAKRRAAAALAHMAEADPINAQAVVSANAVPALSAMAAADCSTDHGRQFAAWALGHIASAGESCAEAVVGATHVLVSMVLGASDKGRRKAAWALARCAMSGLRCAKALAEADGAIEAMVAMLTQSKANIKNKTRAAEVLGLIASAGCKYRIQVFQCEGALTGLVQLKRDRTLSMQGQKVAYWAHAIVTEPAAALLESSAEANFKMVVDKRRETYKEAGLPGEPQQNPGASQNLLVGMPHNVPLPPAAALSILPVPELPDSTT